MKKRLLSVTLALVMTLALLAGCGAGGGQTPGGSTPSGGQDGGAGDIKTGGTVIIGQSAEPITLNPDGKTDGSMDIIAQNVFSRLLKTNNNEEIILDLATGYTVSEDGLTYTFTLPENVKFHDGEPLTSDDVRFTFETILEQQCFAATSLANLESVTCPDDYTAVFQLRQMDARFLSSLAYNGVYILPRHVYEGQDWMGDDSMQTPVGTGPFKFSDWQKGVSITLERNQDFFRGPDLPYLDGVIYSYIADANTAMQSFYNGELDVLGIIAPSSELENMLSSLDSVIVVLIVSAGMLAFVVLYNLNNINITERKRELATLKVLGFFDGEVSAYVFRENVLLTLIGAAFGALLGIVLHRFVIITVEVDAAMFGRNIYWPSFLYSVLFTIGFSAFVNLTMHFKLKKIDMVESLKSVE